MKHTNIISQMEKWEFYEEFLMRYVKEEVKNDNIKDQIIKLHDGSQLSDNQRVLLIIAGLHGALFSRKSVQGSIKWKITIPDSIKFMIMHC